MSHFNLSKVFSWCGFDRDGRPCLVYRVRKHETPDSTVNSMENETLFFGQLLEQGFRDFAPAHKFSLIVDCRGARCDVLEQKLVDVAYRILEVKFPKTHHFTYIVPGNRAVEMAWEAASCFIDPRTTDKVRLVADFEDPLMVEAFTRRTRKAFSASDPKRAPPQPLFLPLSPSPSPSSFYPPPSPGGASNEDDGGVGSIVDERYIDMVSTARER